MLAEHFAINMARELEWELFSGFSAKVKAQMNEYEWPGNVRELKNVVERSLYRSNNPHVPVHELIIDPFDSPYRPKSVVRTLDRQQDAAPITVSDAPAPVATPSNGNGTAAQPQLRPSADNMSFPLNLKDISQQFEIDLINNALAISQFNQKKTAECLGLTYHQLRGYLKKYNLLDNQQPE